MGELLKSDMIDGISKKIIVWFGGPAPGDLPNAVRADSLDDINDLEGNCLLIIDDLGNEACNDRRVCDIFTKKCHHNGFGVILILQNLFNPGRYTRSIAQNAQYLVYFKSPRDLTTIHYLARQMAPRNSRYVIDAYYHATKKPHGYLFIDFTQETRDQIRIRTDILSPICTVYMP